MKFISVIFLLVVLSAYTNRMFDPSYLIIQEKSITINGNTSIGGFSCDYELSGKDDTLFIKKLSSYPYSFSIPVEAFQCGNFLLNKDFQTTLKAKEYPQASVQVLSLKEKGDGTLRGTINLTLVGKSKKLENVKFILNEKDEKLALSADFLFQASEFELTPPKKLGGLIKTDDSMNITVELILKPIYEPWLYTGTR